MADPVKLDGSRRAAVDPDYYWRPMDTCPFGVKVQLLTKGYGAVYGVLDRRARPDSYRGWAPLPKRPTWMD